MAKRIVAREWIVFLGSIIIGFLLTWAIFYNGSHRWIAYNAPYDQYTSDTSWFAKNAPADHPLPPLPPIHTNDIHSLVHHLSSRFYWRQTWFAILIPYLLISIIPTVLNGDF